MEDVGGRGVVHDDDLVQVATQATQVLDVITSVEDAGLPEQAAAESAPLVQEVGDGVRVLRKKKKTSQKLKECYKNCFSQLCQQTK